jgi:galactokinase
VERFRVRFPGATAPRLFFAPGRVNLMGAHLDYNAGPVLPMAVDRGTFLALRERSDRRVVLASTLEPAVLELDLDDLPPAATGHWYDYPLGVLLHLLRGRHAARGADVLFGGNLPIGAGLSSSASICVGTAWAFATLWDGTVDPHACIAAALWGEREWVGVQCGIMDPYAVALSRADHALWLDCKDETFVHVPFEAERLRVAVIDTGIRRELAKGDFNLRVEQCGAALAFLRERVPEVRDARGLVDVPAEVVEAAAGELEPELLARARHVVGELARTQRARRALESGDLQTFGRCMSAAHASLRDLYEVSVPELDCLVESAIEWPGVLGARLTGAGFGGCVVAVLEPTACAGFEDHVAAAYEARFGRRPPVFFFRGGQGPRELRT